MMARRGVVGFDGARLRAAREARRVEDGSRPGRWTQAHVAELMGVERTYYLLWESGGQTPSPATVARLAEVLDVTPGDLVDVDVDQATLAQLRHLTGLTQADVADALRVSASTYGHIEQGRRPLPPLFVDQLVEILNHPADRIRAASPGAGGMSS